MDVLCEEEHTYRCERDYCASNHHDKPKPHSHSAVACQYGYGHILPRENMTSVKKRPVREEFPPLSICISDNGKISPSLLEPIVVDVNLRLNDHLPSGRLRCPLLRWHLIPESPYLIKQLAEEFRSEISQYVVYSRGIHTECVHRSQLIDCPVRDSMVGAVFLASPLPLIHSKWVLHFERQGISYLVYFLSLPE